VKPADRDCEILSLGSNPGRDEQLRAAQAHLERGGTNVLVLARARVGTRKKRVVRTVESRDRRKTLDLGAKDRVS
jgi:hypothetical protein